MKQERNKNGMGIRIGKLVGALLGVLLLVVLGYVLYVVLSYKRIPDHVAAEITKGVSDESRKVKTGEEYEIVTYNIGFGAYTPEFSFFMDGGKESVAKSKESAEAMVSGAASYVKEELDPDFVFWQEVDLDATRSYHVDQYALLRSYFQEYDSSFAVNYDSAFLFYPLTQPHGKSKAGLAVMSAYPIESAERRSLPISTSFSKFTDLDRCYSINRIPVDNGKYLCLINLHLSAYGSSELIRQQQTAMLCEDMEREYRAGNYVICGGDFNHDLKALEEDGAERESWAHPFPREVLPEGFCFCLDGLPDAQRELLHNSARNADEPYNPATTYTVTLDGFIISDNVECISYTNEDLQYAFSDHDPVALKFVLK